MEKISCYKGRIDGVLELEDRKVIFLGVGFIEKEIGYRLENE